MLSRVLVWIGSVAVVVSAAGCGSSDGPGQVPEDEFVVRLASAYCGSRAVCCDNADHPFDTEECVARVSLTDAWPTSSSTLKYDPSAAGECLQRVAASAQCGEFQLDARCDDVWLGNVPVGKACKSSLECARSVFEDAHCIDKVCVSAPRAPRGSQGEPCSGSCPAGEDCSRADSFTGEGKTAQVVCYADDGLYCTATGCAEQVGKGGSCSSDDACRGAAYCDQSSGECRERKSNGASCGSDRQCESGHCAASDSAELGICLPSDEASAFECSFR